MNLFSCDEIETGQLVYRFILVPLNNVSVRVITPFLLYIYIYMYPNGEQLMQNRVHFHRMQLDNNRGNQIAYVSV